MKGEKGRKTARNTGREIAYLAVFVALAVVSQVCLSFLPSVELVTVFFVSYAFVGGVSRGVVAATVFSLLRQLIFGFYPAVLFVYLIYFNLLVLVFGVLGRRVKNPVKALWWLVFLACVCTVCFTMLDNIVTPLWYGLSKAATKSYFLASLPLMVPQVVCTAVTVGTLFLPLRRVFVGVYKKMT